MLLIWNSFYWRVESSVYCSLPFEYRTRISQDISSRNPIKLNTKIVHVNILEIKLNIKYRLIIKLLFQVKTERTFSEYRRRTTVTTSPAWGTGPAYLDTTGEYYIILKRCSDINCSCLIVVLNFMMIRCI